MFDELEEMFKEVSERDNIFKYNAKIYMKIYKAFIDEGFTPEQAFQLLITTGNPAKTN